MITLGIEAVGVYSQGVRAPICRAHCAVIFAIAQLSCSYSDNILLNVGNDLLQLKR